MNNNGFAMMRYFRDLGADAFLLPYSTDGSGNLAHFTPAADTWNIDRWQPYIRPLNIPNTTKAILGRLGSIKAGPSRREIASAFAAYDRFIGSGVAPALFERIGRTLDIFFPYSLGIEFYGNAKVRARKNSSILRGLVYDRVVRKMQAKGIQRSKHCLNSELSWTKDSFDEIGKAFKCLAIPMVYNREDISRVDVPDRFRGVLERIRSADLGIFCCSRQFWVPDPRFSAQEWKSVSKNSDWLLRGLQGFVRRHPGARLILAMVEYGPDVSATKKLITELDLESYVIWLPMMPRREIMLMLSYSDLGVGQFYINPGVLWAGTGYEVLASGKPLLQSFNFTPDGFETEFGHPPPPILDAQSPDDVASHLTDMYLHPERGKAIGQASADWFNRYNGINLARRWLTLLQDDKRQS